MWKQFVNDYLSFTYKERNGIFILLALVALCIFVPFLYSGLISKKQYDTHKLDSQIAQLQLLRTDSINNKKKSSENYDDNDLATYAAPSEKNYYPKQPAEVFYFDPNSATPAEWRRLGIKDKTIVTIQKYLSKGGRFYKPEDISKIWGLHDDDVKRLLPYVKIIQKTDYAKNENATNVERTATYLPKLNKQVDINVADTTALIALPGIGSKLAQRIINFRNKLGGFYSIEQVAETFGLPDSTYQKIKPKLSLSNTFIKKININTATLDDLKAHPYIRYAIANAIIQYRNQHGNFSSISDIKKIMLVTEDVYKKIEAYITVSE